MQFDPKEVAKKRLAEAKAEAKSRASAQRNARHEEAFPQCLGNFSARRSHEKFNKLCSAAARMHTSPIDIELPNGGNDVGYCNMFC